MSQSQPPAPAAGGSVVDRFQSLLDTGALADDPSLDDPDSGTPPAKPAKPAAPVDDPEHPGEDDQPPADLDDEPEPALNDEPDDDDDQPPAPVPGEVTLTIDGQPVKMSSAEASAGYLRTQDYTRKMQGVADKERATLAEAEKLTQLRSAYSQRLAALDATLAEDDGITEEQLTQLRTKNPAEYSAIISERGERERQRQKIAAEQTRVAQEQAQQDRAMLQRHVESEQVKLASAVPEWADAKVRVAEQRAMLAFGQSLGYTPADIAAVTDHRAILVLRKAMLYDQLKSKQPLMRKAGTGVAPVQPGAKPPAPAAEVGPQRKVLKAKQELRRSGGAKDKAIKAFDAILEAQGEKN